MPKIWRYLLPPPGSAAPSAGASPASSSSAGASSCALTRFFFAGARRSLASWCAASASWKRAVRRQIPGCMAGGHRWENTRTRWGVRTVDEACGVPGSTDTSRSRLRDCFESAREAQREGAVRDRGVRPSHMSRSPVPALGTSSDGDASGFDSSCVGCSGVSRSSVMLDAADEEVKVFGRVVRKAG